jgi:hypothetical protein
VILLVDSLYAEAIEAVKARTALSASTPELISILGDIKFETRLWNRSQSVNFSVGAKKFNGNKQYLFFPLFFNPIFICKL